MAPSPSISVRPLRQPEPFGPWSTLIARGGASEKSTIRLNGTGQSMNASSISTSNDILDGRSPAETTTPLSVLSVTSKNIAIQLHWYTFIQTKKPTQLGGIRGGEPGRGAGSRGRSRQTMLKETFVSKC